MWYAKSLSCMDEPHPDLKAMLETIHRLDLMGVREVPVLNWTDLCWQYNVGSVDVVQLDCEGKDCAILQGMLRYYDQDKASLPRVIRFEANHLTPNDVVQATLDSLLKLGYYVRYRTPCNICVERKMGF